MTSSAVRGERRGPRVDFDYLAATSEAESNAQWQSLRRLCPIGWTEHHGGHWVLSKHAEITSAFRDWETFSSARLNEAEFTSMQIVPTKLPLYYPEELDPPLWHSYRRVIGEMLSPVSVRRMHDRVAKWTTFFLDEVIESGTIDLTNDLASPVPGAVVLEWLGFPREDWRRISSTMHNIVGSASGTPERERALLDFKWLNQRIHEEVEERRSRPSDDAISSFINREIDGEPMPLESVEAMVRLAVGGGVETTTSVTSAALVHLHFHPADRQALLEDPGLLDLATEEFLRTYPPARTHARTVTKDVEFGGCHMKAGDRVLLSEVSACHDEDAFPDAAAFVIDRFPNRHIAFGVGIHRCPGSHLARMEFREMLRQVLERIPDYEVIESELVSATNWGTGGGWVKAPAVFTPGERRIQY